MVITCGGGERIKKRNTRLRGIVAKFGFSMSWVILGSEITFANRSLGVFMSARTNKYSEAETDNYVSVGLTINLEIPNTHQPLLFKYKFILLCLDGVWRE